MVIVITIVYHITGDQKYHQFLRILLYKYSKIKSLNDEYIDINTIYKDRIIDVNIYIEILKLILFLQGILKSCKVHNYSKLIY